MKKLLCWSMLLVLTGALLSCELLYSPGKGRWNLLDPKNDLEWVEVVVPAEVDGYIDAAEIRHFDEPVLISQWSPAISFATVIQFDYSKLPMYVESATLEMYLTSASIGTYVDIYIIAKPWTPSTLQWMPFVDGTIRDVTCPFTPQPFSLLAPDSYNYVNITDIVLYTLEKPNTYGLFFAWDDDYLEFHSSRGPNPPILRVTGWDPVD